MTKELETFKVHYEKSSNQWYLQIHFNNAELRVIQLPLLPDEAKDIQNLLNKNSKPNEALECLENIKEIGKYCLDDCCDIWFNTIKQYILKSQEQENENNKLKGQINYLSEIVTEFQKVLEVIKRVYTDLCFILSYDTFEEYNRTCDLISVQVNLKRVNKEEFNLLKRYLNE